MSNYKEFLESMKENEGAAASRLDLRNEKKQVRLKNQYVPKLSKDKDKCSKLLVLADTAIPFDPFKGETTDFYNPKKKFRPEITIETVIKALKAHFKEVGVEDPGYKKLLEKIDLEELDLTDVEKVTEEEVKAFSKYKVPEMVSLPVMNVLSPTLNNVDFAVPYITNFKRDTEFDGEVILEEGEKYPEVLRIVELYKQIQIEKHNVWLEENEALDDKKKKRHFGDTLKEVPISDDYVKNTILAIELPLGSDLRVKDLSKITVEDLRKAVVHTSYSGDFATRIRDIRTKFKDTRDIYPNFYEVDMTVGDEDDKALRARNAKFVNSEFPLKDCEGFSKFLPVLNEFLDGLSGREEMITSTVARKKINDDFIKNFTEVLALEVPFDTIEPYLTTNLGKRYGDLLASIYDLKVDNFLCDVATGDAKESTITEEQLKTKVDISDLVEEEEIALIDDDEDEEII